MVRIINSSLLTVVNILYRRVIVTFAVVYCTGICQCIKIGILFKYI